LVCGCGSSEGSSAAPPGAFNTGGSGSQNEAQQPPASAEQTELGNEQGAGSAEASSEQMQPVALAPAPDPGANAAGDTPPTMMTPPTEMPPAEMPAQPNTTPRLLFDITGIIGTGQSLSVGAQSPNPTNVSRQTHFNNLKLGGVTGNPPFNPSANGLSLVALTELIRPVATGYPSAYPANIYGETFHGAMGTQITTLARAAGAADYVTAHTVVGESGQGMSVIDKSATPSPDGGTNARAYAASLFEASAIKRLAQAQNKTYGIGAIILTHGETDSGNTNYEAAMVKLWTDYNADLRAITGQTETIPLITSQQHAYGPNIGAPTATLAQWKVGVDNPGNLICAGPKYQYPYFTDNVHLVNAGYEALGEKYAEVYFQRVVLGNDWQPLQPSTVEHTGNLVTVHFHVPVPPLAWDTQLSAPNQGNEWQAGKGFELRSGNTRIGISSVEIVGDAVQITAAADVPAGAIVGYAASATSPALTGVAPRRGLLKDSDAMVGAFTNNPQPNFALAFELPVP
jgi:hypothetical protein